MCMPICAPLHGALPGVPRGSAGMPIAAQKSCAVAAVVVESSSSIDWAVHFS